MVKTVGKYCDSKENRLLLKKKDVLKETSLQVSVAVVLVGKP